MRYPESVDLFCRVIDNFGDIGVCWRLARQFAAEHGLAVTLWVDDLASFQRICPALDVHVESQSVEGVVVRHWQAQSLAHAVDPRQVADVVIEAFGCALPEGYVAAMAQRSPRPAWINLEYLSAEHWVEGCHALPSFHPFLPLTKYFFFPGFSDRTGGLLMERGLDAARAAFQRDPKAQAGFWAGLGLALPAAARKVSLFCYPQAPLESLLVAWQAGPEPLVCLVPEGVAAAAVAGFFGRPAQAGMAATRGALTLRVLPFLDQPGYDRLLWACDLNFVRGEDSFVRAQWAARPFVWHIYPQEEEAHLVKLDAFLERYTASMAPPLAAATAAAWHAWNRGGDWRQAWPPLAAALPALAGHGARWAARLAAHGDLASNLLGFVRKIG